MCTSLLYHTFGIRGYEYVRTEYQGGQVIFTINQDLKTCRCSACGAREVRPRGRVERRFRALPIGSRVTTLVRPIRACNVWPAAWCGRSRSPSPIRGAHYRRRRTANNRAA